MNLIITWVKERVWQSLSLRKSSVSDRCNGFPSSISKQPKIDDKCLLASGQGLRGDILVGVVWPFQQPVLWAYLLVNSSKLMLFLDLILLQLPMSEVTNVFKKIGNSPIKSEEVKPNCIKVLLEIDESIKKLWIDSSKYWFRSEREVCHWNMFGGWFIVKQESLTWVGSPLLYHISWEGSQKVV